MKERVFIDESKLTEEEKAKLYKKREKATKYKREYRKRKAEEEIMKNNDCNANLSYVSFLEMKT